MSENRRLAAIMYTDMVGYTALSQRDESLSLGVLDEHRRLLRPVFSKHVGREVKTMGDAFLVEFSSALNAVRCAYDVQRVVRELNFSLPDERRIHLRVGIHLGDVVEAAGDILGDAVNVASRIQTLAEEGGICLTQQVYDQTWNKFELPLVSLGMQTPKNVAIPVTVYKVKMPWEDAKEDTMASRLDPTRVAILPLVNFSPDSADEYFADGMTEELISTVANIHGLTVLSRTSIMQYKGASKTIGEIGRALNAGTILEGSVRKAGNRIRITAQLVDSGEDKHLWAQSFDGDLNDVFAVQSDIAKKIAEALKVKLLKDETRQVEKKPTENMEAYTLYLKGRYHWNKRSGDEIRKATEYFKLAISSDPGFAVGYAGLADCLIVLVDYGFVKGKEAYEDVRKYALKALELDSSLAEAHASYANVLAVADHRWAASESEFKKAIDLNPNYATAHQWFSIMLRIMGRREEALVEAKKALELDPMSPVITMNVGDRLFALKRYDEALDYTLKTLALQPDSIAGLSNLYLIGLQTSRFRDAEDAVRKITEMTRLRVRGQVILATIYAKEGRKAEAAELLRESLASTGTEYIPPTEIGAAYCELGELDQAFPWFTKAIDENDPSLLYLVHDPSTERIQGDERFKKIAARLGL